MSLHADFKRRLRDRAPIVGCFLQLPHPHVVELAAAGGLDCVCLDAEHGPWTRRDLDLGCLAARAAGIAALVRTASGTPAEILAALDAGAAGVVIPHVRSAEQAQAAARAAHYGPGGRGYVGGGRAAGYRGSSIAERLSAARAETSVIVQIEDAESLPHVEAIAATADVDAVFVGRTDLTVSLGGDDVHAPAVVDVVADIVRRSLAAGCAAGMYTPDLGELPAWGAVGASFYLLGSDHGFLRAGAASLAEAARAALGAA